LNRNWGHKTKRLHIASVTGGMHDEKSAMETIFAMDFGYGGGGDPVCAADNGVYESLCRECAAVTADTAGNRLSHSLDGFVWAHGDQCGPDLECPGIKSQELGSEFLCRAADLQFLLEPDLFQCAGIWVCSDLAGDPVDFDRTDDFGILPGG